MDMLQYHKFTIGWNWASDYGTSEDSKRCSNTLKDTPLHNLKPVLSIRQPWLLLPIMTRIA